MTRPGWRAALLALLATLVLTAALVAFAPVRDALSAAVHGDVGALRQAPTHTCLQRTPRRFLDI